MWVVSFFFTTCDFPSTFTAYRRCSALWRANRTWQSVQVLSVKPKLHLARRVTTHARQVNPIFTWYVTSRHDTHDKVKPEFHLVRHTTTRTTKLRPNFTWPVTSRHDFVERVVTWRAKWNLDLTYKGGLRNRYYTARSAKMLTTKGSPPTEKFSVSARMSRLTILIV